MNVLRKKSKQIFIAMLAVLMSLGLFTPLMVHAEEDLSDLTGKTEYTTQETTITSYAIYDKVLHEDMLDGDGTIGVDKIITMSNGLVTSLYVGTVFSRLHEGPNVMDAALAQSIGDYLGGNGTLSLVTNGDEVDEVVFWNHDWRNNNQVVGIEEVKIGFYAVNMDGTYATVDVYDNGHFKSNGVIEDNFGKFYCGTYYYDEVEGNVQKPCDSGDIIHTAHPTKENPIITLTAQNSGFDENSGGILLRFRNPENIKSYHFTYFQIEKFYSWDVVGWTTDLNDPLDGYSDTAYVDEETAIVRTYTTKFSEFSPMFSQNDPDDKEPKWTTNITTAFNATVGGLFSYPDVKVSTGGQADVGRDFERTRDSETPAGMATTGVGYRTIIAAAGNGGYKGFDDPASWTCGLENWLGFEMCQAFSVVENKDGKFKKRIQAYPAHWNSDPNDLMYAQGEAVATDVCWSNEDCWCSHTWSGVYEDRKVAADAGICCYKHKGHASNTVWDVEVDIYKVVPEDQKVLAEAVFYYKQYLDAEQKVTLKNWTKVGDDVATLRGSDNKEITNPVTTDNLAVNVVADDEGVYEFKVELKDGANHKSTVASGTFYIDNTKPLIVFSDTDSDLWYTSTALPTTNLLVEDLLSGVNKIKIMRYKSKDGINWASDGLMETLFDYGENDKTVHLGSPKSKTVSVDLKPETGYMYYQFKVVAEDIAGNVQDDVSPVYKYDAYPTTAYTLTPERWYNEKLNQLNWVNTDVVANFVSADTESGLLVLQLTVGDVYNQNVVATIEKWKDPTYNKEGYLVGDTFVDSSTYVQKTRVTKEDNYYVHVVDKNGHVTTIPYIVDHIDKQVPTVDFTKIDPNLWYSQQQLGAINFQLKDDLSGVKSASVELIRSKDNKSWETVDTKDSQVLWNEIAYGLSYTHTVRDDLEVPIKVQHIPETGYSYYAVKVTVTDIAGNTAEYTSPTLKYDDAPLISYTLDPVRLKPNNTLNWTNKDVKVSISASDAESGVKAVCLANGTSWASCQTIIKEWGDTLHTDKEVTTQMIQSERVLESDGKYLIAKDKNGNTSAVPYIVDHIDKVNPYANFTPHNDKRPISVTVRVYDREMEPDNAMSGVKDWIYRTSDDGGKTWSQWSEPFIDQELEVVFSTSAGTKLIEVTVTDNAGNSATSKGEAGYYNPDLPPTIVAQTDYWWKGETVPISEVLENASAYSDLDGDISDKIIVTRITYADGRVEDYPNRVITDTAQSFVAEFMVEDSQGHVVYTSQVYKILDKTPPAPAPEDEQTTIVYQRYVDEYQIAIHDNSYWKLYPAYKNALTTALNTINEIDTETVTRD